MDLCSRRLLKPNPPHASASSHYFPRHVIPDSTGLRLPPASSMKILEGSILGASFPVVFFNGKNEFDVGNIFLHPSLGLNQFRMFISCMIGISPRHISTFLVRRKKNRSLPYIPSKVPIDEYSDFGAISLERDCFILATMKTSHRGRTQLRAVRPRNIAAESERKMAEVTPPIMSILRRSPTVVSCVDAPPIRSFSDEVPKEILDYLEWPREIYLMAKNATKAEEVADLKVKAEASEAVAAASLPATILFPETAHVAESRELCETCLAAEEDGLTPEFHHCVYDEVFLGFNTTAGPIKQSWSLDGPDALGLDLA